MAQKIRYGAGGVPYYEQTSDIEKEQKDLEASLKQSKAAKAERVTKKKKKVIQEIMGDDLKEQRELLDEII
jgi:hypothetical protein|tara:strand:- start:10155 stop:10367 length:213 start_codon:yes stop_codon:yes gene_type:complete